MIRGRGLALRSGGLQILPIAQSRQAKFKAREAGLIRHSDTVVRALELEFLQDVGISDWKFERFPDLPAAESGFRWRETGRQRSAFEAVGLAEAASADQSRPRRCVASKS
ncbi:hypothetical protein ABEF92_008246 [Exophiala dermatitidis]|uniref:Uncharacterized protein n=1 Tax=Exophiala dermatitidis (strain ATCC 34100 / CBS 525.76 / NIH/UT8656) TaxID=858893 RepID=H6C1Y4_EXODN|nr:uncharacterized protein HMPREF1120_06675 [Exophiala dermatitidis NIH/UT8656]EHY58671.1 hypothetical protein HMPREF1120_06675 [Exophiala dermatitidis NIH/UT8656]